MQIALMPRNRTNATCSRFNKLNFFKQNTDIITRHIPIDQKGRYSIIAYPITSDGLPDTDVIPANEINITHGNSIHNQATSTITTDTSSPNSPKPPINLTVERYNVTALTVTYSQYSEGNAFIATLTNWNGYNHSIWKFPFNDSQKTVPVVEEHGYCLSIFIGYSNGSLSETAAKKIFIPSSTIASKSKYKWLGISYILLHYNFTSNLYR